MKRIYRIVLAIAIGVPLALYLASLSLEWFVSNVLFLNRF